MATSRDEGRERQPIEVKWVGPTLWNRRWKADFKRLEIDTHDPIALSILAQCHDRRVGITPSLVGGMVQIVQGKGKLSSNPWSAANDRLVRVLDEHVLPERIRTELARLTLEGGGPIAHMALPFLLFRLCVPLVIAACRSLVPPCSMVLSPNESQSDQESAKAFDSYVDRLERAIGNFADSDRTLGRFKSIPDSFWVDRLMALLAPEHNPALPTTRITGRPLTNTFLADTRVFWQLRPTVRPSEEYAWAALELPDLDTPLNPLLRDPGFDGIKNTRRPEDLPHILSSELAYPPHIKKMWTAEKFFNSGFQTLRPPEPPVELRDVLVVSLAPPAVTRLPSLAFLKTCWFDFLMRFGQILEKSRMLKSEFRWIEGDRYERMRCEAMLVRQLPGILKRMRLEQISNQRLYLARLMRWWPAYFDRHAAFASMQHLDDISAADLEDTRASKRPAANWTRLNLWMERAWKEQKELRAWEQFATSQESEPIRLDAVLPGFSLSEPLKKDEFLSIYMLLCLPAESAEPMTGEGAALSWGTGFHADNIHLNILWVPAQVEETGWHFASQNGKRPVPPAREETVKEPANLAAVILDWLVNSAIEGLQS